MGGSGADSLIGGAGNDTLDPGTGGKTDDVIGGSGKNVCYVDPSDVVKGCEVTVVVT